MGRADVVRALGIDDERFFEALTALAEGLVEELRASAGDPVAEPHVAKGYACMSSGVDLLVSEIEQTRAAGLRMRAGMSLEEAEKGA